MKSFNDKTFTFREQPVYTREAKCTWAEFSVADCVAGGVVIRKLGLGLGDTKSQVREFKPNQDVSQYDQSTSPAIGQL